MGGERGSRGAALSCVLVCCALLEPASASACSIALTLVGPCAGSLSGATVPADLTQIPWSYGEAPMLVREAPDSTLERVEVTLDDVNRLLLFDEPLLPDSTYWMLCYECGLVSHRVQASAFYTGGPAELPTELGTLSASAAMSVQGQVGVCPPVAVHAAGVLLHVDLAPDAEPWAALLTQWTFVVDGEAWAEAGSSEFGATPMPRLPDAGLLYAVCMPEDARRVAGGLLPGSHDVQITARVQGTDHFVTSDAIAVELDCEAPAGAVPDAAPWPDATDSLNAPDFTSLLDAQCETEPVEPPMRKPDAGAERVRVADPSAGCGCRAISGRGRPSVSAMLWLLGLAAILRVRRRA